MVIILTFASFELLSHRVSKSKHYKLLMPSGRGGGDGFLCQKISMLNDTKIIIVIMAIKHSNKTELLKHNTGCFTIDTFSYWIFFIRATPIIKLS